MSRLAYAKSALAAIIATVQLAGVCRADSPLPPPARSTIWSANRRFFAVMDPDKRITTIYRAIQEGKGEKSWSMYGWFRSASIADDGEHLVVGDEGLGLLPLDHDKQQVMLYFFKRGELVNHVTLDQIIRDDSKLIRTVSHYSWGGCLGLDEEGRYVIKTVEGRTIRFDAATGSMVADETGRAPSRSTSTPEP